MRILKPISVICAAALIGLVCVGHSAAQNIEYDSGTNLWTIAGFEKTMAGDYTNDGAGLVGAGSHVRNGFGMQVGWNSFGGWHYYNGQTEITDYYHPDTLSWTVTGATWSNTPTNADGMYHLFTDAGATMGTTITDGTLLNGTFTWQSNTGGAGTGVLIYTFAVPEPSSIGMLGFVGIGLIVSRRRRRGTGHLN